MEKYDEIVSKIRSLNDEEVSKDYRTLLICGCYLMCFEDYDCIPYLDLAIAKIDHQIKKTSSKKELLEYLKGLNIQDYSIFLNDILEYIKNNDKIIQKYTNIEISNDLSKLIIDLLDLKEEDTILNVCSRNGRFLNNLLLNSNDNLNLKVIGQEINQELNELSSILLSLNNKRFELENLDIIKESKYPNFNKCLIFPPFGIKFDEKIYEKYNSISNGLINQRTSGEWIYIFNLLKELKDNNRIIEVIPDNILFRTYDSDIRKYLLDNNLIEGIISLPIDTFKGINVKTSLLILSKDNEYIKLIDGEEVLKNQREGELEDKNNKYNEIFNKYRSNSILKIKKEDIKSIDYNLTYKSLSNINIYNDINNYEFNSKRLEEVCDILKGCNLTYSNFKDLIVEESTNYKILTSGDIDDNGFINYEELKHIEKGEKYLKYFARNGDIVITSKSTKAKVALIDLEKEENIIIASSMTILRFKEGIIDPLYLKMFLDSSKGKKLLDCVQMGSVIVTISIKDLSLLQIPYIPYENQLKKVNMYKEWLNLYELRKNQVKVLKNVIENFYDLTLNKEKI